MVADEVLISAAAVDFGGETMRISTRLGAANRSHDNREASENLTNGAFLQEAGIGDV